MYTRSARVSVPQSELLAEWRAHSCSLRLQTCFISDLTVALEAIGVDLAIYSFHIQNISSNSGKSAVAAAAYRHRAIMISTVQEKTFKFRFDEDLIFAEMALPDNAPEWVVNLFKGLTVAQQSEAFWNHVEKTHPRKNSLFAQEIVLALPKELSREQNIALMRDFVREEFSEKGVVADWVYHDKAGNPHVHLMKSVYPLTEQGFGKRLAPILDEQGNQKRLANGALAYRQFGGSKWEVAPLRSAWANTVNIHLEKAGLHLRVDARSLRERGLELIPSRHKGPARGENKNRIDDMNERIREENRKTILADPMELARLVGMSHSVFTQEDLARTAARYLEPEEISEVCSKVLASRELVSTQGEVLNWKTGEFEHREVFARRSLVNSEKLMQEQAHSLMMTRGHGVREALVEQAMTTLEEREGFELSAAQKEAVRHVTEDRGLSLVVGYAGAGKSTMLQAANEAWKAEGRRVYGAALSGKAAAGLQESSGIESRTLASWEMMWRRGRSELRVGDTFVIDEAGMVSSEQLSRFVHYANLTGAKLVLVGDPMQLQPIEAGAAFRALSERAGHAVVCDVRRQREEWMREATINFALGQIGKAIDAYDAKGSILTHGERSDAVRTMVERWQAVRESGSVLLLAHANADVEALNAGVRQALKDRGELQGGQVYRTVKGEREFATGDRILFLKNEGDIRNGLFGDVVETQAGQLVVRLDNGERREVNPADYGHFDYGYAATIHKSQGATVDHALVLATRTMDQHLLYVGMSRHRESVELHINGEEFQTRAEFVTRMGFDASARTTLDYQGWPIGEKKPSLWDRLQEVLNRDNAIRIDREVQERATESPRKAVEPVHTPEQSKTPEKAAEVIREPVAEVQKQQEARAAEQRWFIKPAEIDMSRSVEDVASEKAKTNPATVKALAQVERSAAFVYREPDKALSDVTARIRDGRDVSLEIVNIGTQPERYGQLRGTDHVLSRFTKSGKERETALHQAGFVQKQVEQAVLVREQVEREERRREENRRERMRHGVPELSDSAKGFLRAMSEHRSRDGGDERRLVERVKSDNRALTAELLAYDEALTKRFGRDAFTDRGTERIETYLTKEDARRAHILKDYGPDVRRFADHALDRQEVREQRQELQETLPLDVRQKIEGAANSLSEENSLKLGEQVSSAEMWKRLNAEYSEMQKQEKALELAQKQGNTKEIERLEKALGKGMGKGLRL